LLPLEPVRVWSETMKSEQGVTVLELLVVVALLAIVVLVAMGMASGWQKRETVRSAVYEIQSHFQLARTEAIRRNRPCRFVIDSSTRSVQVMDLMNPADNSDDVELTSFTLPAVEFEKPGGGSAITLEASGTPDVYQATFESDGSISAGSGTVMMEGGEDYKRVSVYAAGGTRAEHWNGTSWVPGSGK